MASADDKGLPAYEREAKRVENAAKARAARIRQEGAAAPYRSQTITKLYSMLGIEPLEGDRHEKKRRAALVERVQQLLDAEANSDKAPAPETVPAAARAAEPQRAPRREAETGFDRTTAADADVLGGRGGLDGFTSSGSTDTTENTEDERGTL